MVDMATVTLEGLRKTFDRGSIVAVEDLSLRIDDGELVTVVGPSGCGKSTTLRMIAGLERPTSGRIVIGGEDVTTVHARNRDVAMVFQNYALYPHKTVEGNMAFGLRMSTDLDRAERAEKVRWAAEMMDIEELLEKTPDELSGGQKQRVALGRAIVREPDVFLFDEPLSNLDAKLRTTMRTEIQRLQNELGITSIYVTHDQEEAMTMGDRIAILEDGKLQQVGEPTEVYENPVNEFVGGFIGSPSMNFFEATIEASGAGGLLQIAGTELPLSEEFARRVSRDGEVRLGIRPENVRFEDRGLASTVEVIEPVGSDNYVHLDLGPSFIARVDSNVEPEPGDQVSVVFDEDDILVFDPKTGASLLESGADQRIETASR